MRKLYSLLIYIALPFLLFRLWIKGFRNPAYRMRWRERMGYYSVPKLQQSIWIHAVSLGETIAAIPLIKALKSRYPEYTIVVTTTTPTGSEKVRKTFAANEIIHVYVPFDCYHIVKKFLQHFSPRFTVIMETELWPNILYYCHIFSIPVLLANARLSQKSCNGYAKLSNLTEEMLEYITVIAAQSSLDATRFISLGVAVSKVIVTGNIKFEVNLSEDLLQKAQKLRVSWGSNRLVWIAASTHAGEEEVILQAYQLIKQKLPQLLLVLVPRHPERFAEVAAMSTEHDLQVAKRSDQLTEQFVEVTAITDIIIGDTIGELLLLYAASDVAFVGGSLIPTVGGHNLLEPVAVGIPTISGKHLFNFAEISALLLEAQALLLINNVDELTANIIELFQNPELSSRLVSAGLKVVAQNRGALAKLLELIAANMR